MAALVVRDAFETQCLQNQCRDGQPGIPSPADLHTVGRVTAIVCLALGGPAELAPRSSLIEDHSPTLACTALTSFALYAVCLAKDAFGSRAQTSLPSVPEALGWQPCIPHLDAFSRKLQPGGASAAAGISSEKTGRVHTGLHEEPPCVLTMQSEQPFRDSASSTETKQVLVQASGAAIRTWTCCFQAWPPYHPTLKVVVPGMHTRHHSPTECCLTGGAPGMRSTAMAGHRHGSNADQHRCLQAVCDYSAMLREVYPGLVVDPHFLSLRSMQEYAHGEHAPQFLQWPAYNNSEWCGQAGLTQRGARATS